jgi:hypothetical protein
MRADRVLPEYEPERQVPAPLTALIPPPPEVRQRAWECAFRLGAEHSNIINDEARWHWLLDVVNRGADRLTWRDCGALLRLYTLVAQRERAAGAWGWR